MRLDLLIAGRIMVFLAQTNSILKDLSERNEYTEEFLGCDLCFGFWTYLALDPVFPAITRNRLLNRVASAAVSAFLAHIFVMGLKFRFGVEE